MGGPEARGAGASRTPFGGDSIPNAWACAKILAFAALACQAPPPAAPSTPHSPAHTARRRSGAQGAPASAQSACLVTPVACRQGNSRPAARARAAPPPDILAGTSPRVLRAPASALPLPPPHARRTPPRPALRREIQCESRDAMQSGLLHLALPRRAGRLRRYAARAGQGRAVGRLPRRARWRRATRRRLHRVSRSREPTDCCESRPTAAQGRQAVRSRRDRARSMRVLIEAWARLVHAFQGLGHAAMASPVDITLSGASHQTEP